MISNLPAVTASEDLSIRAVLRKVANCVARQQDFIRFPIDINLLPLHILHSTPSAERSLVQSSAVCPDCLHGLVSMLVH